MWGKKNLQTQAGSSIYVAVLALHVPAPDLHPYQCLVACACVHVGILLLHMGSYVLALKGPFCYVFRLTTYTPKTLTPPPTTQFLNGRSGMEGGAAYTTYGGVVSYK